VRAVRRPLWQRGYATLAGCWRGLLVCALVALAARFLAGHYGVPVMLMALLLGMALNFLSAEQTCQPGIDLASRQVLRWGVALLGLKFTADQVQSMGWQPVLMVVLAVSLTIGMGLLLARWLGFRPFFGLLSGGSVGICGASAALAIAAAFPNHPQKDRATLFVVISVSTLSTVAMIAYPMLARWLDLDALQAGFFLGGTIHDVAQVVGAGYSMGQATGDAATVIKLMRVAMLVPVIAQDGACCGRNSQCFWCQGQQAPAVALVCGGLCGADPGQQFPALACAGGGRW